MPRQKSIILIGCSEGTSSEIEELEREIKAIQDASRVESEEHARQTKQFKEREQILKQRLEKLKNEET